MEPHIHLSGISLSIELLAFFLILLVWRLIQLVLRDTPLGPPISFVLH